LRDRHPRAKRAKSAAALGPGNTVAASDSARSPAGAIPAYRVRTGPACTGSERGYEARARRGPRSAAEDLRGGVPFHRPADRAAAGQVEDGRHGTPIVQPGAGDSPRATPNVGRRPEAVPGEAAKLRLG